MSNDYFTIFLMIVLVITAHNNPELSSLVSIIFISTFLAVLIGLIIRVILQKREQPTFFDAKIQGTTISSEIEGLFFGPKVKPGRFNQSNIEGSDARKKHLRAVAGIFAFLLQEIGCLNRPNVNASRKAISTNFKTGAGTREAMLFLQKLMIKVPVDGVTYMRMAYEACTKKQMSALALSLCTVFGGRKLVKKEWNVVGSILDGLHLPIQEKLELQHKYYSVDILDDFIEVGSNINSDLLYRRDLLNRDWDIAFFDELKHEYHYFQLTGSQCSNKDSNVELTDVSFSLHDKHSAHVVEKWVLEGNKLPISALGGGEHDLSLETEGFSYSGNWNPYEGCYIYTKLEPISRFDVFVRLKLINQGLNTSKIECVMNVPIKKGIFTEEDAISSIENGNLTIPIGTPAYNKLKLYLENQSGTLARCCEYIRKCCQ